MKNANIKVFEVSRVGGPIVAENEIAIKVDKCQECGGTKFIFDGHGDYSASGQANEIPCPVCQTDE